MLSSGELDGDEPAWTPGLDDWTILKMIVGVIIPIPPALPPESMRETPPPFHHDTKQNIPKLDASPASETLEVLHVGPKGVGGWLLLYCIALVIIGPLYTMGSMSIGWKDAEPAFKEFPSLKSIMVAETLVRTALLIVGAIVGIRIWGGSLWGRKIARSYLMFRLFFYVGFEILVAMFFILSSDLTIEMMGYIVGAIVGVIFGEVIYFSIWWTYFKKSKRVRNTYGL